MAVENMDIVRVDDTGGAIVSINSDWQQIIDAFISYKDVRASSRETYKKELTYFFLWVFRTNRSFKDLTETDIRTYREELLKEGRSNLTVGNYLVTVRRFYAWAESRKLYPNIAREIKSPHKEQAFKKLHLTDKKSSELLQHFKERSIRDYAIVNLILRTGLRCIEVVRADIADITFRDDRRILYVLGKGKDSKDKFVVLTDKAWQPIKEYLATRKGAKAGQPLFVSDSRQNKGERLTTRSISSICKEGLRSIGLDGREFSAHSLRHTTAVAILKHGGSITDVQDVLRHASPVTSEIYTESVKIEMRLERPSEALIDEAF